MTNFCGTGTKLVEIKVQPDLQSIGSSPGLHILCARDTIMIPLINDKELRLLLKTRGYWGLQLSLEHDAFFRYSATTDHEELPYVLDLAVHLVHLDR